jgi:hypothetical protein
MFKAMHPASPHTDDMQTRHANSGFSIIAEILCPNRRQSLFCTKMRGSENIIPSRQQMCIAVIINEISITLVMLQRILKSG